MQPAGPWSRRLEWADSGGEKQAGVGGSGGNGGNPGSTVSEGSAGPDSMVAAGSSGT